MTLFKALVFHVFLSGGITGLKLRQASDSTAYHASTMIKHFAQDPEVAKVLASSEQGSRHLKAIFMLLQAASKTRFFSPREASILQELASSTAQYIQPDMQSLVLANKTLPGYMGDVDVDVANWMAVAKYLANPADTPTPPTVIKKFSKDAGCRIAFVGNRSQQTAWTQEGGAVRDGNDDGIVVTSSVFHPKMESDILDVIKNPECTDIVLSGSAHTVGWALGSPTGAAVCMLNMWFFKNVDIDWCANTVKVGAGVTGKDLAATLGQFNRTLKTWLLHKDIGIATLMTSQAQGVFQAQHRTSQGDSMVEMTVINGAGVRKVVTAGSAEGKAWVHGMGDLGVILDVTFNIVEDTLIFCTVWCSNVSPDADFDGSGVGGEINDDLDLDFLFMTSPMMGPATVATRVDERTFDLDPKGLPIQDAQFPGGVFQVYKLRTRHIDLFAVVDQIFSTIFKAFPDLQTQFWTYIHGGPYPDKPVQIVRQATIENMHDFSQIGSRGDNWSGDTMFLFGSLYAHPQFGKTMYKEMLRTSKCVKNVAIEVGLIGRAYNDHLPTYLGHQWDSVEIFLTSWAPRVSFEEYWTKFTCLLRCTHNITELEFHLGEMFSRDLYKLAGFDWITDDNVKQFKAIEAAEDPNHKFTTAFTYEIGRRLEPQEHVCTYCARLTFC